MNTGHWALLAKESVAKESVAKESVTGVVKMKNRLKQSLLSQWGLLWV